MAFWSRSSQKKEKKKESPFSILIAIGIALAIRWAIAEAYVIPSGSMLPTLLIHDHIFVNKFTYGLRVPFSKTWLWQFRQPERGEIIVFKDPRETGIFLIKRVVGLPGETLSYHDNQLYINGKQITTTAADNPADFDAVPNSDLEGDKSLHQHLTEDLMGVKHSVLHHTLRAELEAGPIQIPPHSLFVMGDHRDNSADSRVWGFVPMDNILGRAMFVWMACEDPLPVVNFACNPLSMRWTRLGHIVR